jgi:signal transduction histidine kinase
VTAPLVSGQEAAGEVPAGSVGSAERRLRLAIVAWVGLAGVCVALFAAAIPARFARLRDVCVHLEAACKDAPYPPPGVDALREAGLSATFYAGYLTALEVAFAAVYLSVAAIIIWRRPTERVALLAGFMLLLWGVVTWPGMITALVETAPVLRPVAALLGFLGVALFILFFHLFPTGRFVPPWSGAVAAALVLAFAPQYLLPGSALAWTAWPEPLAAVLFVALAVSIVAGQAYRYRHDSDEARRRQTRWVVLGSAAALVGFAVLVALALVIAPSLREDAGPVGFLAGVTAINGFVMLIPVTLGVAVLRRRLWDLDPLVNRALVYGALTACVIGLYVVAVGYLGALFQTRANLAISLAATGLVAVLFQPLRERIQRGVNRLMYGQRDEPYQVVSRLGQRLEAVLAPEAVLAVIVETVSEALRLPYAAIELEQQHGVALAAAAGTPTAGTLRLPLNHRGERTGWLLLAPRSPDERFSAVDRRLLDDLARQAGVAAHAVRLNADLQRSREQLVIAREEERRRLRRDLHDGLGSRLAALNLHAGAVRRLLTSDPAAADAQVGELRTELRAAIADIRRLVYDLRPPALDELGLLDAIRERAAQCHTGEAGAGSGDGGSGLTVTVEAAEPFPALPAAVEVATYRIVVEALTNAVRHARATTCTVRLALSDHTVVIEVDDDGIGLPADHTPGVGLVSMRERAAELGGSCVVSARSDGGTRVAAHLPVAGTPR